MRLQRAFLGPASGNRDYGLLATTPELRLSPRHGATLGELIFGARASITTPMLGAVFFPLGARNGEVWALARLRSESFENGVRVFADALFFPQSVLDEIGWAVHRALAIDWGPPSKERLAGVTMDDAVFTAHQPPHSIPPAGALAVVFDARVSETTNPLWINAVGVDPDVAVQGIWETMLPDTRTGRSFSSISTLRWSPPDPRCAEFDIVVGAGAPNGPRWPVTFTQTGLQLDAAQEAPWDRDVYEFRRAIRAPLWRRANNASAQSAPRTHDEAFANVLARYAADDPFAMLANASQIGVDLARNGRLDESGARGLAQAIRGRFNTETAQQKPEVVAHALDLYSAHIDAALDDPQPALTIRLASTSGAFFLLSQTTIRTMTSTLFGNPKLLENTTKRLTNSVPSDAGLTAWAHEAAVELMSRPSPEIADFAWSIFQAGTSTDISAPGVMVLTAPLLQFGKGPLLRDTVVLWKNEARAGRLAREELRQRLERLSQHLSRAKRDGVIHLHDRRTLALWLAIDEAAAYLETAGQRGGGGDEKVRGVWPRKSGRG